MNERGDELRRAARGAVERAERERAAAAAGGEAPRPGDLYTLAATADFDIEWLVVRAAGNGCWLVLPADLSQFPGGADVEVPAGEPGGPLTVYGRFAVDVPGPLLRPELRGGRISEERRAEAERRWLQIADGAQPPPREADYDPDHRRRLVELAAAQRALDAAAGEAEREDGGGGGKGGAGTGGAFLPPHAAAAWMPEPAPFAPPARSRPRPPRWITALAAMLAVAVVGLAGWNLSLQRQVERLSGARAVATVPAILVDDDTRAEVVLPAAEEEWVVVTLAWLRQTPEGPFRFRVLDRQGGVLAVEDGLEADERGRIMVLVPRPKLERGSSFRLERLAGGGWETVLEKPYRLAPE